MNEDQIIASWDKRISTPVVSIVCTVYNHAPYLQDTFNGFLMQKTSFPFEIIVHDDCSIDESSVIIKEYEKNYPHLFKCIYQNENQYSKGVNVGDFIYPKIEGKYISYCEGDDYWIDSNKLQAQIDFLEQNPEYGMCYTKAKVFYQETKSFAKFEIGSDYISFENLFVTGNTIPTLTTCYRRDLFMEYLKEINPNDKKWLMRDLPAWLWFSKNSKIYFFSKVTSVYRVLKESASHSVDVVKRKKFEQSCKDIRSFYSLKYEQLNLMREYENFLEYRCYFNNNKIVRMLFCSFGISFKYLPIKTRFLDFIKSLFVVRCLLRLKGYLRTKFSKEKV